MDYNNSDFTAFFSDGSAEEAINQALRGKKCEAGELLIDGRFRLIENIATGGMGVIWKATRISDNDSVILKFRRPDMVQTDCITKEWNVYSNLKHPYINSIYREGAICSKTGLPFIVLSHCTPRTLVQAADTLSGASALDLFTGVLEAIIELHYAGYSHLDLKPDNILVIEIPGGGPRSFEPRIIDFGLSERSAHISRDSQELIGGTYMWSAPEQLFSEFMAVSGPRMDIFSLGLLLYQICTHANPPGALHNADPSRYYNDLDACLKNDPLLEGHPLRSIVCKASTVDALKRYATVTEMLEAIRKLEGKPDSSGNGKKTSSNDTLDARFDRGSVQKNYGSINQNFNG